MNAKRGYVPEDDKNFSKSALVTLRNASRHIRYLINEGYDLKQASTFVGNHFVLSERQRLAIVRSISTDEQLRLRKSKEKTSVTGEEVWIDGFNTVITLEVMLMYGKEASNRKQEIDRQHYTIPNQRPKDKHCGKI
ncbi:MAG: DUF434 domain-containing protein [Lachnospiraceae bacterium]|nr:DUF434 domain-containing protein [Lachnospiraceae bacterium]